MLGFCLGKAFNNLRFRVGFGVVSKQLFRHHIPAGHAPLALHSDLQEAISDYLYQWASYERAPPLLAGLDLEG